MAIIVHATMMAIIAEVAEKRRFSVPKNQNIFFVLTQTIPIGFRGSISVLTHVDSEIERALSLFTQKLEDVEV